MLSVSMLIASLPFSVILTVLRCVFIAMSTPSAEGCRQRRQ